MTTVPWSFLSRSPHIRTMVLDELRERGKYTFLLVPWALPAPAPTGDAAERSLSCLALRKTCICPDTGTNRLGSQRRSACSATYRSPSGSNHSWCCSPHAVMLQTLLDATRRLSLLVACETQPRRTPLGNRSGREAAFLAVLTKACIARHSGNSARM